MTDQVTPAILEDTAVAARNVAFGQLRSVGFGVGRALFNAAVSIAIVLILWVLFLKLLDVSPYVGKGPADVYEYLFQDDDASEHLSEVLSMLGTTLKDAAIGFVAGMVAAVVLAAAIVLSKPAERTVMPVAMLMRSVPLIAMTPVIRMIFGQGVATVAIIGGIVVLFPALVTIVFGLRSTSRQMHDLVAVYGGSPWVALRKVDLPSSMPSFFAAIRISVPGAITGALIAEWLATGQGIGYGVVSAIGQAKNNEVWALVITITLVSLALYTVAQVIETFVLARFGKT